MNADFNLCDLCGERVPKEHRMFVVYDRSFDGVEDCNDGQNVDLCATHLVEVIKALCGIGCGRLHNYDAGKQILEVIKGLKKQ